MKPQTLHAQEDRLLDFVYGELPPLEARAVETHLEGCPRCSELLAGIRGVRSTMSQLTLEPAPDAGLESLMAYAQQAARNAAAGPAPQPTWWRRWLVPVSAVAAVCVFGIVTLQVNKTVDLTPAPAAAEREFTKKDEAAAPKILEVAQSAPPPPTSAAPIVATPSPEAEPMAGMTPPPSDPAVKLDDSLFKGAPKNKKAQPASKSLSADFSNAGTGGAFERDAYERGVAEKRGYDYDRRDAMTQSGAPTKPKPIAVAPQLGASTPSAPPSPPAEPPAQAAEADLDEVGGTEAALVAEAQVQQQAPGRNALRVGGGVGSTADDEAYRQNEDSYDAKDAEAKQELASLEGMKTSKTAREQRTRAPTTVPATSSMAPAPVAAPAMPPAADSAPAVKGRAERSGPSVDELSKMATAAFREDNRVREAELLRLALNAGATGSERLGLLNRLCDAEFSIGRREAAFEACNLVLKENPKSSAAQVARKRLASEAPAPQQAKPGARGPLKAAPVDKMEAPAEAR
jgi:anti-sigma factor RsiW